MHFLIDLNSPIDLDRVADCDVAVYAHNRQEVDGAVEV